MRQIRKIIMAAAAIVAICASFVSSASANVPGGGGTQCSAFTSPSITSSTATAHVSGTDNCASPRFWVRMTVGINTSSGSPSRNISKTCTTNLNYVESCAETGLSVSVSNPAGTQTWEYCGSLYYYSAVTSALVKTIQSCGHSNG